MKDNLTKQKTKGRNNSIQSIKQTFTSIKTRNNNDIYQSKSGNSKFLTGFQNISISKSTKGNKVSNLKKVATNLTKTKNDDNMLIPSMLNDNFNSNVLENRNDTLYFFSKIKAENKKMKR